MGTPSGRQVLVPGYMAGVEAAHERFGTLEFAELFEPAIYFADNGFEVTPFLYGSMLARKDLIDGSPEMTEIFTKEGVEPYQIGDHFNQPQLAATLRAVAEHGAAHMYTGPWARSCVNAVNDHGGRLTIADFEGYEVTWSDPYHTRYRDFDVYALGGPGTGGANLISALNLLELADLRQYGHWTRSSDALYRFIQISRAARMIPIEGATATTGAAPREVVRKYIGLDDFSAATVTGEQTARLLWELMERPAWKDFTRDAYEASLENGKAIEEILKSFQRGSNDEPRREKPGHSDAVVAVDSAGNVAAVVHTINSNLWGTGIVVGGVALNDSAAFQQRLIQEVGPGGRIPDPTSPLVVLSSGRPILGASCIGGGLHEAMMQNVLNVLDFGMDPKTAVETSHFMTPVLLPSESFKQTVAEGDFPVEVLDGVRALGQELEVVPRNRLGLEPGYWIGIEIDPATGLMTGGVPTQLNGIADGF
jgi:gamma-glutamyltranspeptidase/glutathione hydrolase